MEAFTAEKRPVLLIDEIDKADIEFPNDLLLELDKMEFYVYETKERIQAVQRPIVIITSNNEKELPDAFYDDAFFIIFNSLTNRNDTDHRCSLSRYKETLGGRSAKSVF